MFEVEKMREQDKKTAKLLLMLNTVALAVFCLVLYHNVYVKDKFGIAVGVACILSSFFNFRKIFRMKARSKKLFDNCRARE